MPTDEDLNIDGRFDEFRRNSQDGSVSTSATSSTTSIPDSSFDRSAVEEEHRDLLERIFYRTSQEDSKTTLHFISSGFFAMFLEKMKADFSRNTEIDNTTTTTKCIMHVQGLKCEIVLDSHFNTVTISGVGHKLWRSHYFPKAARSLFKRFVQEVDSQVDSQDCQQSKPQTPPYSPRPAQVQSQAVNGDIISSFNGIQPLFVSTPNCPGADGFRQPTPSEAPHVNTNDLEMFSNGRKLSFMVSKVCDLEAVIEDLKSLSYYLWNICLNRLHFQTSSVGIPPT